MDTNDIKALIEALRTKPAEGGVTIQSGPRKGNFIPDSPLSSPIGMRRDGYRLYLRENQANGGGSPLSYEEWLSRQE